MMRAKFICYNKQENEDGVYLQFQAVTSGSKENEEFFKWTPSGQLSMGTINKTVACNFELGKEYYLDFSSAN